MKIDAKIGFPILKYIGIDISHMMPSPLVMEICQLTDFPMFGGHFGCHIEFKLRCRPKCMPEMDSSWSNILK